MKNFLSRFTSPQISLWLVLFVAFLDEAGIGLVYPMFSSMIFLPQGPFHLENTSETMKGIYLGVLLAALPITSFFCAPILGALSDQKGRKPLYLFSLTLATLGYLLSLLAVSIQSIYTLIFSRCVTGIAAGNVGVVSATVADLSTPDSKAKHFGLFSMASGVGFMIGPVFGGLLSKISFVLPFFLSAIAVFTNLLMIYFFFQETHTLQKKSKIQILDGIRNIRRAFHLSDLKIIFLAVIFICFAWSFFYEFIPVTWISDFGYNTATIGLFYAFGSGVFALSSGLLIRPFQNRFSHHSLVFYSVLSLGCLMWTPLFIHHSAYIWIYLFLVNFLIALAYPTYSAIVSNSVDENSQGEILGILQSIQMFAFGISPLFAGTFVGLNPHSPMILGGLFMIIGALIFGIFLRKRIF